MRFEILVWGSKNKHVTQQCEKLKIFNSLLIFWTGTYVYYKNA